MAASPLLTRERIDVHGLGLELIRHGAGQPMLVLHGAAPFSDAAPFLATLGRGVHVIAPSHPGFGGSPRPEDFDTVYDLIHLYLDVLDALPFDTVSLMGFCFGGWIAAELAAIGHAKLDRLILVDPVGIRLGDREQRDIVHLFNTHPKAVEQAAWADPGRRPTPCDGLGWQLHIDRMGEDELVAMARNMDALCTYSWSPHLHNRSLKRWLRRVTAPTLVVWGAQDRIVDRGYGEAYAALIPGAEFAVIEDAGHHPELEQPAAFSRLVLDWMGVQAPPRVKATETVR